MREEARRWPFRPLCSSRLGDHIPLQDVQQLLIGHGTASRPLRQREARYVRSTEGAKWGLNGVHMHGGHLLSSHLVTELGVRQLVVRADLLLLSNGACLSQSTSPSSYPSRWVACSLNWAGCSACFVWGANVVTCIENRYAASLT